MKSAIFFLIILICLPKTKARTILIDPGHGGSDEGAKTSKYAFDKGKRVRRKKVHSGGKRKKNKKRTTKKRKTLKRKKTRKSRKKGKK